MNTYDVQKEFDYLMSLEIDTFSCMPAGELSRYLTRLHNLESALTDLSRHLFDSYSHMAARVYERLCEVLYVSYPRIRLED